MHELHITRTNHSQAFCAPTDHLGSKSDRGYSKDRDRAEQSRARNGELTAIRKRLIARLRCQSNAQRILTPAQIQILDVMLSQDNAATIAGRVFYRPGREHIAKKAGCSTRTVTEAIGALKALGILNPRKFEKGGRCPGTGRGLATEFYAGQIGQAVEALLRAGLHLSAGFLDAAREAGEWACDRVSKALKASAKKRSEIRVQLTGLSAKLVNNIRGPNGQSRWKQLPPILKSDKGDSFRGPIENGKSQQPIKTRVDSASYRSKCPAFAEYPVAPPDPVPDRTPSAQQAPNAEPQPQDDLSKIKQLLRMLHPDHQPSAAGISDPKPPQARTEARKIGSASI